MFCLIWPENCAPSVDIVGFLLFLHVTTQFTTLAPASETGNNIFHPCATDSPENSYLCSGK